MHFETTGQRLYYLRSQCRLSRKYIEENYGISINTLKTWEDGSRKIKKELIKKLVEIYNSYGVHSTEDWILGIDNASLPFTIQNEISEESYILKEIANFESFYSRSRIIQVMDDYMSPWVCRGDYVGGIVSSDNFIGKACIIETQDFGTLVRIVQPADQEGFYNLISASHMANILNVPIKKVYAVIWLRKRSYVVD